MASNAAIVDEQDPLVHYDPGLWDRAGSKEEFNNTTSYGAQPGATASFTFVGTSITVYGTIPAGNASRTLTFVVDNSISGSYRTQGNGPPADAYHSELWASPAMSNGTHTLVLTQQTQLGVFLDYFIYNTTSTSVSAYFIDDRDSRITYTPAWKQDDSVDYFQHAAKASTSAGDSFSVAFEGKAISLYGPITDMSMNASMAIDGGPSVFFTPSVTGLNIAIYNSGDLTDGQHTLIVTAQNEHPVWVDYFLVTPSTSTLTPSSSSSSSSPMPKPSTPVGQIVGPILGAVLLVALLVATVLYRRSKRRRRGVFDLDATVPMEHVLVPTPFAGYVVSEYTGPSKSQRTLGRTIDLGAPVDFGTGIGPIQSAHPIASPGNIAGSPSLHLSYTSDVPPPQYFEVCVRHD
ncbi:hypothetical protein MVEN_02335000 [Mycena venus]|uniref:Transmembrane protein n=1 Tax=Mycena venus TaxID=2733690 RepID=A0A8H6X3I8_9AGAR|nr:hypothetical protein MVEN_02335000 [Mycena venus]